LVSHCQHFPLIFFFFPNDLTPLAIWSLPSLLLMRQFCGLVDFLSRPDMIAVITLLVVSFPDMGSFGPLLPTRKQYRLAFHLFLFLFERTLSHHLTYVKTSLLTFHCSPPYVCLPVPTPLNESTCFVLFSDRLGPVPFFFPFSNHERVLDTAEVSHPPPFSAAIS